jgi:hypothetical protein
MDQLWHTQVASSQCPTLVAVVMLAVTRMITKKIRI